MDNYPVGDGTVSLKITDLERSGERINTANTPELQQALTVMLWRGCWTTFPSYPIQIQDWIGPSNT